MQCTNSKASDDWRVHKQLICVHNNIILLYIWHVNSEDSCKLPSSIRAFQRPAKLTARQSNLRGKVPLLSSFSFHVKIKLDRSIQVFNKKLEKICRFDFILLWITVSPLNFFSRRGIAPKLTTTLCECSRTFEH